MLTGSARMVTTYLEGSATCVINDAGAANLGIPGNSRLINEYIVDQRYRRSRREMDRPRSSQRYRCSRLKALACPN